MQVHFSVAHRLGRRLSPEPVTIKVHCLRRFVFAFKACVSELAASKSRRIVYRKH